MCDAVEHRTYVVGYIEGHLKTPATGVCMDHHTRIYEGVKKAAERRERGKSRRPTIKRQQKRAKILADKGAVAYAAVQVEKDRKERERLRPVQPQRSKRNRARTLHDHNKLAYKIHQRRLNGFKKSQVECPNCDGHMDYLNNQICYHGDVPYLKVVCPVCNTNGYQYIIY